MHFAVNMLFIFSYRPHPPLQLTELYKWFSIKHRIHIKQTIFDCSPYRVAVTQELLFLKKKPCVIKDSCNFYFRWWNIWWRKYCIINESVRKILCPQMKRPVVEFSNLSVHFNANIMSNMHGACFTTFLLVLLMVFDPIVDISQECTLAASR